MRQVGDLPKPVSPGKTLLPSPKAKCRLISIPGWMSRRQENLNNLPTCHAQIHCVHSRGMSDQIFSLLKSLRGPSVLSGCESAKKSLTTSLHLILTAHPTHLKPFLRRFMFSLVREPGMLFFLPPFQILLFSGTATFIF